MHFGMDSLKPSEAKTCATLARLEAACRRHGIPATVQRRVVLEALVERTDHPTVDQVYGVVKERLPGVSRTTVYRTLETFADLGLARRTHHFAAAARFDGNMERHHHLVCTACGKVVDYTDRDLRVDGLPHAARHDFMVADYSMYIEGVCSDCKARTAIQKPSRQKTRNAAKKPRP